MATHSSLLAWRIPWTEEPGRLQSLGSQRVGFNSATNTFTVFILHIESLVCLFIHSRTERHPGGFHVLAIVNKSAINIQLWGFV